MKYDSGKSLFAVDLAGTLLFGIEGATAAMTGSAAVTRANADFIKIALAAKPSPLPRRILQIHSLLSLILFTTDRERR